MYVYKYIHICTHSYTNIYIHDIHIRIHEMIYISIVTAFAGCICIYLYIYIYIHIYTYIYICAHVL